jgi:hypothetical protein
MAEPRSLDIDHSGGVRPAMSEALGHLFDRKGVGAMGSDYCRDAAHKFRSDLLVVGPRVTPGNVVFIRPQNMPPPCDPRFVWKENIYSAPIVIAICQSMQFRRRAVQGKPKFGILQFEMV